MMDGCHVLIFATKLGRLALILFPSYIIIRSCIFYGVNSVPSVFYYFNTAMICIPETLEIQTFLQDHRTKYLLTL